MTLAAPTPMPPRMRQKMKSPRPKDAPEPMALIGEQDRRDHHAFHPAEAIGQGAGEERADRRAEQGERDRQPDAETGGVEFGLQRENGAVDDGGIEAEEKPAQRRGRGNENDVAGIWGDDNPFRDD